MKTAWWALAHGVADGSGKPRFPKSTLRKPMLRRVLHVVAQAEMIPIQTMPSESP